MRADGSCIRPSAGSHAPRARRAAHLLDALQVQRRVEPRAVLLDARARHRRVDAAVRLERRLEEPEHRLVARDVGLHEARAGLRIAAGAQALGERVAGVLVHVAEADGRAAGDAELHEGCADAVGAT